MGDAGGGVLLPARPPARCGEEVAGGGAGWGTRKPSESACQEAVTGGDFPLVSAGAGRSAGDSRGWRGGGMSASEGGVQGTGDRGGQQQNARGGVGGMCKGAAAPLCPQMCVCKGGEPPPWPRCACVCECARGGHCHSVPRLVQGRAQEWDPHIMCVCHGGTHRPPLQRPRCACDTQGTAVQAEEG